MIRTSLKAQEFIKTLILRNELEIQELKLGVIEDLESANNKIQDILELEKQLENLKER